MFLLGENRSQLLPGLLTAALICVLGLVSTVTGASCPYQDPHCRCDDKTVTCVGLQTFPTPVDRWNDSSIDMAIFYDNLITQIPANSFPPGLVSINFTGSRVLPLSIDDQAFATTTTSLQFLEISAAGIYEPPPVFLGLDQLLYLSVDSSWLEHWYNESQDLSGLSLLSSLYLSFNSLTTFNFDNLPHSLDSLSLSANFISNITSTKGGFRPPLRQLLLDDNRLTTVPSVLSELALLSFLDLSHNQIFTVTFDDFPANLNWVDLSSNQIVRVLDSTSNRASTLASLILKDNPMVSISPTAFQTLGNLTYMVMTGTNLTRLPLALMSLATRGKFLVLNVESNRNLSCPCPPPAPLVQWFESSYFFTSYFFFTGSCQEGEAFTEYLTTACNISTPDVLLSGKL